MKINICRISFLLFPLAMALGACQLTGSGKASPATAGERLPSLPISSSLAMEGQTLNYQNLSVTVTEIDSRAYPSTVSYRVTDASIKTIEIGEWFVEQDILVKFSFENNKDNARDGLVLATFHDLNRLKKNNAASDENALFIAASITEGEIRFYEDGFLTLREVRDNDPLLRDDDSAEIEIWHNGVILTGIVREFSHTVLKAGLSIEAGEIFVGKRPGSGQLDLKLEKTETMFADSKGQKEILVPDNGTLDFDGTVVSFDPLPIIPKIGSVGEFVEPEGYRALLTMTASDTSEKEFILLENQSVRWGRFELLLQRITPESGTFDLIEYERPRYPTQRLSPNDPIVTNQISTSETAPRQIESFMEIGDSLDFAEARFEFTKIVENDPTNLFDDQVVINLNGAGFSDTVYLREGRRQTFQGNNRYWIIEVDRIQKTRGGGQARMRIETGKFIGR